MSHVTQYHIAEVLQEVCTQMKMFQRMFFLKADQVQHNSR